MINPFKILLSGTLMFAFMLGIYAGLIANQRDYVETDLRACLVELRKR